MRAEITLLLALAGAGCATLAPRPTVARPLLSPTEQAVAEAALRAEVESYGGAWPIVLLDETSSWMPPPDGEPEVPVDVAEPEWLLQNPPIPTALRAANTEPFALAEVGARVKALLYPRSRFERMHQSRRGLRPLTKPFGGREPAVLEVSRPTINDQGEAHVLVHVYNTWNGCGSINMYVAHKKGAEWVSELKRILVIW